MINDLQGHTDGNLYSENLNPVQVLCLLEPPEISKDIDIQQSGLST